MRLMFDVPSNKNCNSTRQIPVIVLSISRSMNGTAGKMFLTWTKMATVRYTFKL